MVRTPIRDAVSPPTPAAAAPTKPAAQAAPAPAGPGSKITDGQFSDASILNPVLSTDTSSGRINDLLYGSLVTISGDRLPDTPSGLIGAAPQ